MTKTDKLAQTSLIMRSFVFIEVIARALFLKMKIFCLEETNFQLENNDLRVFGEPDETLYLKSLGGGRKNLILAVSNEEILLYKKNNGTDRSSDFFEFMKILVEKINEEDLPNYLIVMDDCSIHLAKQLKDFYSSE